MTVCRDVGGDAEWFKVRDAVDDWLEREAGKLQIAEEIARPDAETWGRTPAQAAAQRRAMGLGGGA